LKYHGRIDTQVKLNGQRIELGEIEHHLKLGLPQGSQSAVELVTTDANKALAAFIELPTTEDTTKPGASLLLSMTGPFKVLVRAIEASLLSALPSYYIPKLFFPMVKMPMTTSGKLDRRNLRTLANGLSENRRTQYRLSEDGGARPSTPAELELARLWENVLNLKPGMVGRESGFFQLGGDSAAAMRLSALAREHGMNLSVSAMFRNPTLSQMVIEGFPSPVADDEPQSSPPALEPLSLIPKNMRDMITKRIAKECEMDLSLIEEVYPCTKLQEGLIALSMQEPGAYVAQTVYKLPASIDIESFRQAWNVVFEAEPILRTRIVYTEEYGFLQAVFKHQIEWKSVDSLESMNEASRHLPNRQGGVLCTFTIAGERTSPHFIWTAHHSIYGK
jgi:aryl carrier-like protein